MGIASVNAQSTSAPSYFLRKKSQENEINNEAPKPISRTRRCIGGGKMAAIKKRIPRPRLTPIRGQYPAWINIERSSKLHSTTTSNVGTNAPQPPSQLKKRIIVIAIKAVSQR